MIVITFTLAEHTGRAIRKRIKEHKRDNHLPLTETSAVSEHGNKTGHFPDWETSNVYTGILIGIQAFH